MYNLSMGFTDYFKPVDSWSAGQVKEFLKDKNPEEYNLIDVRQPQEYEEEHLPGAQLIPVGELPDRLDSLDPSKPTIAY
jgi:rhodanese-related sulfurtransferase